MQTKEQIIKAHAKGMMSLIKIMKDVIEVYPDITVMEILPTLQRAIKKTLKSYK